jgi:hypothetical protein
MMKPLPRPLFTSALVALVLSPAAVPLVLAHDGHDHAKAPPDGRAVTSCVRTGRGAYTYESVPNWNQMPEGKQTIGPTHGGIVVDKQGHIYVSVDHPSPHGLLVYSPDGKLVKAVAEDFAGIHGMCINDEGDEQFIYAARNKDRDVAKLRLDGTRAWTITGEQIVQQTGKYKNLGQLSPTGVAVGPDGSVYVADGYGQNWVHQFDKDRKHVKSFGGGGDKPGQFKTCHGIALDNRGEKPLLLVCDRENRRLQHFDLDGTFVAVITEDLRRPCSVSIHGKNVAIAELAGRVAIIDGKNEVVSELGDNPVVAQRANYRVPPTEWKEGIFTAPHGVSYDKDGNLYVMDWNESGRVSKLKHVKR